MAPCRPTVLLVPAVEDFLQYVLDHHAAPSTLVVCSSKEAFLERLRSGPERTGQMTEADKNVRAWTLPTLRLLSTSCTLKLVFCPEITHLRAYLATYSISIAKRETEADTALRLPGAGSILALLNAIQLHRPTSALSAQGLNRTFALAVEAAHDTGSVLVITECADPPEPAVTCADPAHSDRGEQFPSSWDEEIAILNVTTKRLGEMSVGRTVRIRAVAERWCTFHSIPSRDDAV